MHSSRFQAPGPDRCKHGLTAHRGAVPACPHLAHKTAKEATLWARGQTVLNLAGGRRVEKREWRRGGMEQGTAKERENEAMILCLLE